MARIEHRQPRRGAVRARSLRTLPATGWIFLVLAAVVALIELWPVVDAWMLSVTEWWSDLPQLLPAAAQVAGRVALPAAVVWANPRAPRSNAWLWKGALLVAIVQLVRYPNSFVQQQLFDALGGDGDTTTFQLIQVAVSLILAVASVLGAWALSEGLKDAGGRSRLAVVIPALAAVAMGVLLVVPTAMAGFAVDLNFLTGLLSVVVNALFIFTTGLIAGRAIAGMLRGCRPVLAWRVGALAGAALFLLPLLSLGTLLLNSYVLPQGEGLDPSRLFSVATFFGWPLFAIAVGMGVGRFAATRPSAVGAGFVMKGKARLVQVA